MTFSVLIPARMASTRLPGKPLADIGGLPMVVRVAQRAARSAATRVVVAADHAEIVAACRRNNVEAILTGSHHATGSDRLAEACLQLGLDGADRVVNVQGDEPLIEPSLIDACAALLLERPDCVVGTLAQAIVDRQEFENPNVVKVVLDGAGRALYFSRAPIPHWRDAPSPADASSAAVVRPLRHIGVYSYRAAFLRRFPGLPASPLEAVEALEQLRVLWHGERIAVHVTRLVGAPGVDTPGDLDRVRARFVGPAN